jgi:hypothetical protein
MHGASYQQQLFSAIGTFLPSGFFRIGPCGAEPAGRRNA